MEGLASENLDNLTDAALSDDLRALRRHIDRLELEFSRRLTRFDRDRGYLSDRAASLTSWLRSACRLSPSAAAQHVDVARHLPDLPVTEHALRNGDAGFHHATVIARCASEIGADAVRPVESILVEAAHHVDPGRLRLATRHLRHCVDPDGALAGANADHVRRRLHISQTIDGIYVIDGLLDAEDGALVRTAINALDKPLPGDNRTAAQRRADALVEIVRRQLQCGDLPSVAGQRPHLNVTVSDATLRGDAGAPAGEMQWAGPVVAELVRRLACDASVSRVRVGGGGEPLDVGRAVRTIPAALRRALVVRDGGCRFPGCDRPPEWTDGHHLRHWADGGETKLENLVLLCRLHHRVVHEGQWRLWWGEGGGLVAEPP